MHLERAWDDETHDGRITLAKRRRKYEQSDDEYVKSKGKRAKRYRSDDE